MRVRLRDRLSRPLERRGDTRAWLRGFAFADGDLAFLLIGVLMTFVVVAVTTIGSDATGAVASGSVASGTSPELFTLYSSRLTSGSAMTSSSVSGTPVGRLAAWGEEEVRESTPVSLSEEELEEELRGATPVSLFESLL